MSDPQGTPTIMKPVYKFSLPEREAIIRWLQEKGHVTMRAKAQTYASKEWANANFWDESVENKQTPAENALNHHTKHQRTTAKFIHQNGKDWVDTEPPEGRFMDAMNYPGIEYTICLEQGIIPIPGDLERCFYCGSFDVRKHPPTDSIHCNNCGKNTMREALEDFEFIEPGRIRSKSLHGGLHEIWHLNTDGNGFNKENP